MTKNLPFYSQVRELRAKGHTYTEINEKLGTNIPKASMSYICKGVVLTGDELENLNKRLLMQLAISRQKALAANRNLQLSIRESIRKRNMEFNKLSDREAKIALSLLYLGEGAKYKSHRGLYLGSSDPKIIIIYLGLMKRCYGAEPKEFKARVSYRADQNLEDLEKFWSKLTKIPKSNFYKTKPDPRTIGKPTLRSEYKGVCVLTRKGTEIQLELQAIADIIFENMGM